MSQKIPVTVVVPIKNEAANLEQCLSRLHSFAEVLVVDSGSTDNSIGLAQGHGAKVIQFKWNGQFPKKRNWCLRNYQFTTDWVLFLDADEYVTPEFLTELEQAVSTKSTTVTGLITTTTSWAGY
jgi:glycosyltransferase involved in cell wall biosynthesis